MKKLLFIIPIVILAGGLLGWVMMPNGKGEEAGPTGPKPDSVVTIRLSFVGDLMCHAPQFNNVRVDADSFNFHPCYDEVRQYLTRADLTIGNLETTMGGVERGFSGYPRFCAPDDYITALKQAGFDFIVTGNNHSIDTEEKGLLRTLDVIDRHGLPHTGTYRSPRDRDSIRVMNVKGIGIAILNYTYSTNGLPVPQGKPYLVNLIDTAMIRKDMMAAKALPNVDLVTVVYHFGTEYQRTPDSYQKMVVKHATDCGADLIIGSHPHVLQPVEFYTPKNSALDTSVIAWSLGNFFSNQGDRYKDAGAILHVTFTKNVTRDSLWLSDLSYTPTWVYRGTNPAKKRHIILPLWAATLPDSAYPYLTVEDRTKLKQAWEDSPKHMTSLMPSLRMEK